MLSNNVIDSNNFNNNTLSKKSINEDRLHCVYYYSNISKASDWSRPVRSLGLEYSRTFLSPIKYVNR